jgi:hypothetical protein
VRKIEQIEQQIRELSSAEFAELREWFLEQDWVDWDSMIEDDARVGKLDKAVSESRTEHESGKSREI